ncbi:MAG: hypothetical protein IPJ39_18490 [Saprospiraceae bacterium]|nr:hypothetical protein [Saprospiraceae bacterium]
MNAKPYLKEMTWLGDYRKKILYSSTLKQTKHHSSLRETMVIRHSHQLEDIFTGGAERILSGKPLTLRSLFLVF